jgi:hypothetical protein
MEISQRVGLWEQIEKDGWESLSNAACGRVGGIMGKRLGKSGRSPRIKNNKTNSHAEQLSPIGGIVRACRQNLFKLMN